jgi:hypothetical protein
VTMLSSLHRVRQLRHNSNNRGQKPQPTLAMKV